MKHVFMMFALSIVSFASTAQTTQTTCSQSGSTINCDTYNNSAPTQPLYQPGRAQSFVDGFQRGQLNAEQVRAARAQAKLAEAQTDALQQQTRYLEAERQRASETAAEAEYQHQQAEVRARDAAQRKAEADAAAASVRERSDAKTTAARHAEHEKFAQLADTAERLESQCIASRDPVTCDAADAYKSELRFRRLTQPASR